ncbi:uncharacterized protein LOC111059615 [Nilaparvata lugens]|uniref:uncharacterized protein LOC111059615 n=1 Tax=Nilaparvata lugens TaxID=108931 RepID=UPI000B99400D|nr:uncharacterized protein LOC111059615 [Nilaparvata lugens]
MLRVKLDAYHVFYPLNDVWGGGNCQKLFATVQDGYLHVVGNDTILLESVFLIRRPSIKIGVKMEDKLVIVCVKNEDKMCQFSLKLPAIKQLVMLLKAIKVFYEKEFFLTE